MLERWLQALVETPGLTAVSDLAEARRVHVQGGLEAASLVEAGPVADVGSGGGSPGIPLALALPALRFDVVESSRRKCAFLRVFAAELANLEVVCARAEEHGRGAGRDAYGTVLARALAPPPVAAEWCLPLLRPGGRLILFVGPSAAAGPVASVAERLAAEPESGPAGFLLLRKTGRTPAGFPRRPGLARKRPLA